MQGVVQHYERGVQQALLNPSTTGTTVLDPDQNGSIQGALQEAKKMLRPNERPELGAL